MTADDAALLKGKAGGDSLKDVIETATGGSSVSLTQLSAPPGMDLGCIKLSRTTTVSGGIAIVLLFGVALGFALPSKLDMSQDKRIISSIIGWIYFAAWSISFYPQFWLCVPAVCRRAEHLSPAPPSTHPGTTSASLWWA